MEQAEVASELRLLCNYDGENHIVSVDRSCSLSLLRSRLFSTFFGGEGEGKGGRSFTLKYQLPNHQGQEDLFINIKSDDDLKNMIHEYDSSLATAATGSYQHILLFLFPSTVSPMPAPTLTSSSGVKKPPRKPVAAKGALRRCNEVIDYSP